MGGSDSMGDFSELRNAVGAIRIAVSMLRADRAPWLSGLPGPQQVRIRSVLAALDSATAELVQRVSADTQAIATQTARARQERDAPVQPVTGSASGIAIASLSQVLHRLEVVTAVQAAVLGLARSRPNVRRPWTIVVQARSDSAPNGAPIVVLELRCEVADDSSARGPGLGTDDTLPGWLHECLQIADAHGGGLTRGRDGTHEVVRMILPTLAHTQVPLTPAANDVPARRRVA